MNETHFFLQRLRRLSLTPSPHQGPDPLLSHPPSPHRVMDLITGSVSAGSVVEFSKWVFENLLFLCLIKGAEMGTRKFGVETKQNRRRALSVINQSLVAAPSYPCVVNKRVLSEKKCNL
ncbi:uncharacterized protein LOC132286254 [Cornus florida]|uniref:uncharacterized protein LOC132286254 n=1 Tax=Cornus florida TaxID=4283 RepID=UPI00289C7A70|nr:uncharacterized protein LOC132286254 [Cornus florida]